MVRLVARIMGWIEVASCKEVPMDNNNKQVICILCYLTLCSSEIPLVSYVKDGNTKELVKGVLGFSVGSDGTVNIISSAIRCESCYEAYNILLNVKYVKNDRIVTLKELLEKLHIFGPNDLSYLSAGHIAQIAENLNNLQKKQFIDILGQK